MKKDISLYYAVSKTGKGVFFVEQPQRNDQLGIWMGRSVGCISSTMAFFEGEHFFELPSLKWSDDPIEITVSLEIQGFTANRS